MDRPWGPWVPDAPDFESPGLAKGSKNAIPLNDEQRSYGPLKSVVAISDAVPGTPIAATSARNLNQSVSTFVGTTTALFKLGSGGAWDDVSKSGGYSVDLLDRWEFTVFGNFLIAAGDLGDPLQKFDLDGGVSFSDLSASAPFARHIATVRDFVMVGNTSEAEQGARPDQVWWSAIGDPETWPIPGSDQAVSKRSGRQVLPDSGSVQSIQSGVGGADALVFCERRIWRVNYEGPPTVFRFDPVETARGAYAPGSVVSVGNSVYFLSRDGFWMFDGAQSRPIGAGLWNNEVLDDLDDANRGRMSAAVDRTRNLIFWLYPGAGNVNGRPNKLLIYNYLTNRAMPGDLDAFTIAAFQSRGYTLEELDQFGTLDTLPAPLDSPVWAGGADFPGVVGADGKLGSFTGPHLEANFRSNQFGGERFFISGVRPYVNSSGATVSLRYKDEFNATTSGTNFIAPGADSYAPFRVTGRYGAVSVKVAAGSDWPDNGKSQGFDIRMQKEGLR